MLTLGTINAYVTGAAAMARQLTRAANPARHPNPARAASPAQPPNPARPPSPARPRLAADRRFLAVVAAVGLLLITLFGFGLISTAALVAVPTALFLTVYLGGTVAAERLLPGPARAAAIPAALAVVSMLPYCGWALITPAAIGFAVWWRSSPDVRLRDLDCQRNGPAASGPAAR